MTRSPHKGQIRAATRDDVPAITEFLSRTLRGGAPSRYARYLSPTWGPPRDDVGHLIEDSGQIKGFIGAIYAERDTEGQRVITCNLTSISVDDAYRDASLRLFQSQLRDKQLTVTSFSASPEVQKILAFFKFEMRPNEKLISVPVPTRRTWRAKLLSDIEEIAKEVPSHQERLARDHAACGCAVVLARIGRETSLVIAARRGRGPRAFADVLFASDLEIAQAALPKLHISFARQLRTAVIGFDAHLVVRRPRWSYVYRKLRPIMLRSPVFNLRTIDGLYSELALARGSGE